MRSQVMVPLVAFPRDRDEDPCGQTHKSIIISPAGKVAFCSAQGITLGQADPDQIRAQAVDEEQCCQVLYYAGARLLTEGQTEVAREVLTACLRLNADCLEWQLAAIDLASTGSVPHRSSLDSPSQQIERMSQ